MFAFWGVIFRDVYITWKLVDSFQTIIMEASKDSKGDGFLLYPQNGDMNRAKMPSNLEKNQL